MTSVSKNDYNVLQRYGRAAAGILGVLMLCLVIGACMNLPLLGKGKDTQRGFTFSHKNHVERGLDDCSTCHDAGSELSALLSAPAHELCAACHDIPEDQADKSNCGQCHTRSDYSVSPRKPVLPEEVVFAHQKHLDAEVKCEQCHQDPDAKPFPEKPLMPFCMDCHEKTNAVLNDCAVCHQEIRKDVPPTLLGGRRIAHDSPPMWEKVHGRESRLNREGCTLCHDYEQFCEKCHAEEAPKDHTLNWRRKSHGLRADWNRERCAACHEEEFCVRCHHSSTPDSHRAGWGFPRNRHCVNCHYPVERNQCTVCHEEIEHKGALPSPHSLGWIPGTCRGCHPLGLPHQAPHPMNSSTTCSSCHP